MENGNELNGFIELIGFVEFVGLLGLLEFFAMVFSPLAPYALRY